ncbi:MAG: hypothetical protein KDC38_08475 [Planctomycetes bacterium]|nr:hypothetical protein [Planctomycetota bacterium]
MRVFVVPLTMVAGFALGSVSPPRLHLDTVGFSIRPLQARPEATSHPVMTLFLPPSDGFAPNVTVRVVRAEPDGTIEAFANAFETEFTADGLEPIATHRPDDATALFEYRGESEGLSLHWYAKAVRADGVITVAIGAATERQWSSVRARIRECVESLTAEPQFGEPPLHAGQPFESVAGALEFIVRCVEADDRSGLVAACSRGVQLSANPTTFDKLVELHQEVDLREKYGEQSFPTGSTQFTLGGHGHQYRHLHLDFVRREGKWTLSDVWQCR